MGIDYGSCVPNAPSDDAEILLLLSCTRASVPATRLFEVLRHFTTAGIGEQEIGELLLGEMSLPIFIHAVAIRVIKRPMLMGKGKILWSLVPNRYLLFTKDQAKALYVHRGSAKPIARMGLGYAKKSKMSDAKLETRYSSSSRAPQILVAVSPGGE